MARAAPAVAAATGQTAGGASTTGAGASGSVVAGGVAATAPGAGASGSSAAGWPGVAAVTGRTRETWWTVPLHPLTVLVALAIQWTALARWAVGLPPGWKGRAYPGTKAA